jgi:hypothetical protein
MRCQEYASNIHILDLANLKEKYWIDCKKEIVENCKGCYYHCYYDEEKARGIKLLSEIKNIKNFWGKL